MMLRILLYVAAEIILVAHGDLYHFTYNGYATLVSRRPIVSLFDFSREHLSVSKMIDLSALEKRNLVNEHNKYRQKVAAGNENHGLNCTSLPPAKNMSNVKWSPNLEQIAKFIANDCLNVSYIDRIDFGKSDTAAINFARDDVINDKFSLYNYSIPNLFKRWTEYVSLFNPKDFGLKKIKKLSGKVYEYANLIHDQNIEIGCAFASINTVDENYEPRKHTQLLYCIYSPGAPKHRMPYEPQVIFPSKDTNLFTRFWNQLWN